MEPLVTIFIVISIIAAIVYGLWMATLSKEMWKDPEYRKKMAKVREEYWSDPENRKKASKARKGKNNGSYGTHWYYDPNTLDNIKCKPDEVPEGYIKGRKMHNKSKGAKSTEEEIPPIV